MVEKVFPVPKCVRVNGMILQPSSALNRGREIFRNGAVKFHFHLLEQIPLERTRPPPIEVVAGGSGNVSVARKRRRP